jgi:P2 family phage contractile tail tube protein
MSKIPGKLIDYTSYKDGKERLGTVDVTLPNFDSLSQTLSGAGIMGEIDSSTIGQFGSQTITLNWRTLEKSMITLLAPGMHALDFRGGQEVTDSATGDVKTVGVRVSVRARHKGGGIGKLAPNSSTESTNEMEVYYIKIFIDEKAVLELDKLNYIFIVDGVDYLATLRRQLGL